MKTITLHPTSLLAGIGLCALAVVAMGQKSVPTNTSTSQLPPAGEYEEQLVRQPAFVVHPRDWVQITEGVTYIVPAGKILAITALGSMKRTGSLCTLSVDGVQELEAEASTGTGTGVTMKAAARGLSIPAGSLVEVQGGDTNPDDVHAWGYLVDE